MGRTSQVYRGQQVVFRFHVSSREGSFHLGRAREKATRATLMLPHGARRTAPLTLTIGEVAQARCQRRKIKENHSGCDVFDRV